jgi:hypothetical protein
MAYGIVSDFTHSPVSINICKRPPTLTTISDPYSRFQPFIRIYKKIPNFPMELVVHYDRLFPPFTLDTRAGSSMQIAVLTLNISWGAIRKHDINGGNQRRIGKLRYPVFP